ncbi:MAG: FAD-dependent oxidoreductase, partial [Bacteroidota bacterium]
MSFKVAIIGSGIAGIASAIRLAVRGNQVDLFEANEYPGGKLSEIRNGGYRFDAGPSLFTFPELVDELFKLAGEEPEDHFSYLRLDEVCRYFYEDGTRLTAFADRQELVKELVAKTEEAPDSIIAALDKSAQLYDFLGEMFMFRSLHDPMTFLGKS